MDAVLRATVIYAVLLVLFRLAGKRSLAQVTTFDLVLLLVISEATQQALLGEDFSITNAVIVVTTLVGLDRLASYLGWRFPRVGKFAESMPMVLVEEGKPIAERLRKVHMSEDDILTEARERFGLLGMDQIRYAVLERSGGISIVPYERAPR